MKRKFPAVIIALLLVGLAAYQMIQNEREVSAAGSIRPPEMARNKPVPSFTLKALDGKGYEVGGEREKPLIVNFWASWCGPCHEEAPDLKRMYDKYGGQMDLYSVNVTKDDRLEDVKGFVKKYDLSFPVLLDQKGTSAELYRILFVPTSFLIDKHGILRDVIHVLPPDLLEQRIQLLINS
ncbi:redoxin domain-containing protein [Paenibacillus sp. LMG 31456]|uniref:Redoxin domain-containing protein n=1 Tax=Paenibacillus foliorum TaxID=2654974 RepID=A0A972GVZ9_9BACL|nr:TlpA disulfide reductase family protein [Paenibacillus foliorum]NOU97931.1 redoxin domain-containing protein [Paenibacillus foliorum]